MKLPLLLTWPLLAFSLLKLMQGLPVLIASLPSLSALDAIFTAAITIVFGIAFVGLWARRLWGLVLLILLPVVSTVLQTLNGYPWREKYPIMGPWTPIVLLAIFAIPALFAWGKMSWRLIDFRNSSSEAANA